MLRQFLIGTDRNSVLIISLFKIPVILLSLSLHELAHGYIAYRRGDGTAKAFGRLTLNPIKHLDVLGALFMFLFGFGWAKPVPVNTRNLRNPKRDIAFVSLAGPVSNLILAFIFAGIYMLMWKIDPVSAVNGLNFYKVTAVGVVTIFSLLGLILNVGLALFNLIPIPPLDGSNILLSLLPQRMAVKYVELRHYVRFVYLGILIISWVSPRVYNIIFYPLTWLCSNLMYLFCLPFKFLFTGELQGLFEVATVFAR